MTASENSRSTGPNHVPRIGVVSLGCPKNLVDSQRLISVLVAKGYKLENDFTNADLVIVNTCGFIEEAIQESFETIMDVSRDCAKVMVMGCLGTQKDLILEKHPDVVEVIGPGRRAHVLRAVERIVGEPPAIARQNVPSSGVLLTPPHYAYLKIAEGCRNRCSFCIIPKLRGDQVSRSIDNIMAEARDLVTRGVREILVISQNSSDFGIDFKGDDSTNLVKLCEELGTLSPRPWIRLHYVYPNKQVDKLIPLMRDGLIVPYLDMPLQHASPRILKSMRRPGNIERTLERINEWREICPDIAFRSNFITGFPGETEAEFEELLSFIKEAKLDRVGTFAYSDVEGADANNLEGHLPLEVRKERARILMEVQAEISEAKLATRIGKQYDMLVDHVTDDNVVVARTKYEAPDIDGVVYIENYDPTKMQVKEGDLIKATITDCDEHDNWANMDLNITPRTHIPFRVKL